MLSIKATVVPLAMRRTRPASTFPGPHSTIELAHNLGMSVVAEGVESLDTLNRLSMLGCDMAQGFVISKPLSFQNLTELLEQSRVKAG